MEKMKVELYHKQITKFLLNKYANECKNHEKKLQKILAIEQDYNDDLRWKIINLKVDINKIILKIQKVLIIINKYAEIKNFLTEIKIYSSKQYNASYKQLINMKNGLINKADSQAQEIDKQIFLINQKKLNIESLNELFEYLEKYEKKQNLVNENAFTTADDFNEMMDSLYNNIMNLTFVQNKIEKKIGNIKTKFDEEIKSYKNHIIENKEKLILYKEKSHILELLKEKNEKLKKKKIDIYEKINYTKNLENNVLKIKTYNILNNLYKNNLINKDELFILKGQIGENEDILIYLNLIENKTNLLILSKKEMLLKYPDLIKKNEKECIERYITENKIKEKSKNKKCINRTFERINKNRYYIPNKNNYYVNSFNGKRKRKAKIAHNKKDDNDYHEIFSYIHSNNDDVNEEK